MTINNDDCQQDQVLRGYLGIRTEMGMTPLLIFRDSSDIEVLSTWPFTSESWSAAHVLGDGDWIRVYHRYQPDLVVWEGSLNFEQLSSVNPMTLLYAPTLEEDPTVTEYRALKLFFEQEYPAEHRPRPNT